MHRTTHPKMWRASQEAERDEGREESYQIFVFFLFFLELFAVLDGRGLGHLLDGAVLMRLRSHGVREGTR